MCFENCGAELVKGILCTDHTHYTNTTSTILIVWGSKWDYQLLPESYQHLQTPTNCNQLQPNPTKSNKPLPNTTYLQPKTTNSNKILPNPAKSDQIQPKTGQILLHPSKYNQLTCPSNSYSILLNPAKSNHLLLSETLEYKTNIFPPKTISSAPDLNSLIY